jgi:hypothetical protein
MIFVHVRCCCCCGGDGGAGVWRHMNNKRLSRAMWMLRMNAAVGATECDIAVRAGAVCARACVRV